MLAVLNFGFRRIIHTPLVEPPLAQLKHIPVREHLRYVAYEALGGQSIPSPKGVLAVLDLDATIQERKLRRALHLAEHLPDGVLLVEEESFGEGRGDRNVACRNACGLSAAEEVDFATLGHGLLGRGDVCAR